MINEVYMKALNTIISHYCKEGFEVEEAIKLAREDMKDVKVVIPPKPIEKYLDD